MYNPFLKAHAEKADDNELVKRTLKGERSALEELILRHQNWIYNIALRMVMNPDDAQDVTQEILIKMTTRLSSYKGKSAFRTWLYRIAFNHMIDMSRKRCEIKFHSFEEYGIGIDRTPDMDLPDPKEVPVDINLIVEETRLECIMAMLLCLDRRKRLVFILSSIFGVSDKVGSEIMNISGENYRQLLSRGRHKIFNFMNDKCGLINKDNPCRCSLKTKALIDHGIIDPRNLLYNTNYLKKVREVARIKGGEINNLIESKCFDMFREAPFQKSPDFVTSFREIINDSEFHRIFNLEN